MSGVVSGHMVSTHSSAATSQATRTPLQTAEGPREGEGGVSRWRVPRMLCVHLIQQIIVARLDK